MEAGLEILLEKNNIRNRTRFGEMVQKLRACTVLAEDLSSIPSNYIRQLTTICK